MTTSDSSLERAAIAYRDAIRKVDELYQIHEQKKRELIAAEEAHNNAIRDVAALGKECLKKAAQLPLPELKEQLP